ncbi:MAG: replicative DNA helicase [Betaproteobacteria bacterium]|nr:replicative DNA helicase [Betaproteobacteria bacterium]
MKRDPSVSDLRIPPHSPEAEQSVLGGLLIDNDALDKIADVIDETDFYSRAHRLIFAEIRRLLLRGQPADVITVAEGLESAKKLEAVGNLAYLGDLALNVPTAANIRRYAEIVRERAILRSLAGVGTEIAEFAHSPAGRTAGELLDLAEQKVFDIAEKGARTESGFQAMQPLLTQVVERIDMLCSRADPSDVTGVSTGFTALDSVTTGLQQGDLIVIAGRPSMGKTAFALNIAENIAVVSKLPVAVFSMEMSAAQLVMRMIGSVGRLDQRKIRTGRLANDDWAGLSAAVGQLHEAPLFIDETPALTPIELRSRARRLARQHGGRLGAIVVDYLQLMSAATQAGENRASEISEISRALKALAKELSVPVLALSQLNRSLEQRTSKRPVMSDLRESGAIEQDADLILFIYRDEVYNPDSADKGLAEIIIGKQRNGPIDTIRLAFVGEFTRFENV